MEGDGDVGRLHRNFVKKKSRSGACWRRDRGSNSRMRLGVEVFPWARSCSTRYTEGEISGGMAGGPGGSRKLTFHFSFILSTRGELK